jgi:hypothetical protein
MKTKTIDTVALMQTVLPKGARHQEFVAEALRYYIKFVVQPQNWQGTPRSAKLNAAIKEWSDTAEDILQDMKNQLG